MNIQLQKDVKKLAEPGTRRVGSRGHAHARTYLLDRMNEAGLIPYLGSSYELPYEIENHAYTNLAGLLPGRDQDLPPLLLVAHYDTCGDQPGADDNAAAIAIWLALIDLLRERKLDRPLLFLFPDAEEPPHFLSEHMGSTNFYLNQRRGDIHAGIVLDLVGHDIPMPGMEDLIFAIGAESHPALADALIEVAPESGLRNIATLNRYIGDLSDHHILRENGEAYLFFTCGRWEHYHQNSDTPEKLNYTKMERIANYLLRVVEHVSYLDLSGNKPDFDPVDMELVLLRRSLGDYLDTNNIRIENRDDIQNFVLSWVRQHSL